MLSRPISATIFNGILRGARLAAFAAASVLFLSGVSGATAQERRSDEPVVMRPASSAASLTNTMSVLDERRLLQVGDRLSYRVVEERGEPISLVVADSGEVEVPLIGRVPAEGKSCRQLANAIKVPLDKEYFFDATVIVALDVASVRSRGTVYVTGQVRSPGPVEIPPGETFTVSKAILKAGGLADFANKRKVRLVRKAGGDTTTVIVDIEAVINKGRLQDDAVLQPDDMIVVPERLVNF
jgi:polysaccharide export outer membrane protein